MSYDEIEAFEDEILIQKLIQMIELSLFLTFWIMGFLKSSSLHVGDKLDKLIGM